MFGCRVVSITSVSVFVSVKLKRDTLSFLRVMLTGSTVSLAVTFINASVQLTSSNFNFIAFGGSSDGGGGSVVSQEYCGSKRKIKVSNANKFFVNKLFEKDTLKNKINFSSRNSSANFY